MKTADKWVDYELLDATDGERLERWGDILLIRPDPQVIWHSGRKSPLWERAYARYIRSSKGGGAWEMYKKVPEVWSISYGKLKFNLKPMGFKHTGLFPEQAVNWDMYGGLLSDMSGAKVLNLFAYTGGATLACLVAGAAVTHVDASKGMVSWASDNAASSGLKSAPVRWIVDDCVKFVQREIRRGNTYDGIIMDPPSYGRGPGGEIWKLEDKIYGLISDTVKLLKNKAFLVVNSYTTGLSPAVMDYMLNETAVNAKGGSCESYELGLRVTESGCSLPCGATSVWRNI